MISASFDAWLRPSTTSQPKTRIIIRYSRRTGTSRDLAATHSTCQTQVTGPVRCFEAVQGALLHRRPAFGVTALIRSVHAMGLGRSREVLPEVVDSPRT